MATLTNTRIKNTYDGLLKTTDNDALGGTYKLITDGLGNSSNIYLGTGGNLGIGIIPTEKFHVNGDAIVSGDLHVDAIKPIASSNPIKFKNFASTELVRITDSGNVGIGTENPDDGNLQIGDSNNPFNIAFAGTRSKIGYNGLNTIIQGGTSKGVAFCVNNNTFGSGEVMRIKYSNGYVGIGETDPSKPLTINKNQSETAILVQSSDTGLSGIYLGGQSDSIKGGLILDNSDNSLQLRGYNNANRLHINSSGRVGIGTTDPNTLMHTFGSGNVAKFQTTSFGGINLSRENNVGNNSTHFVISFNNSDSEIAYIKTLNKTGGTTSTGTGYEMQFATLGSGYQTFYTNGSERMRINSSGNVGIGTSNPTRELEVTGAGNVYIKVTAQTDNDSAAIELSNTQEKWTIANSDTNDDALEFKSDTSGDSLVIKKTGAVGIGTSTVDDKLHILGDSVKIQQFGQAGITFKFNHGNNSYSGSDVNYSNIKSLVTSGNTNFESGVLTFETRNSGTTSERMRIDSSGNVGIGTNDPKKLLHIASTSAQSVITLQRTNSNTTGAIGALQWTAIDNHTVASMVALGDGNNEGAHITFNTTSAASSDNPYGISERMRIDSSGRVGIGLTNPSANLHVYANGKAAFIRSTYNVGLEVQGGGSGTDIAIFKNTSGTEKFSLNTSGQMFNLGMASSSSANASLMHNSSTGLIYRYTSSIRYKEDVKDLTNAVDKIMKLRPVEFKPKDSLKYTTGMIAEEVFEVMPEITFKAEIEGFDEPQVDGISYEPMHAYYIKAIQEQQEMINELKSDIETLKSQINS